MPITIKATYDGNSNSKITYTESGSTISATWQSGDKILVAYDGYVSELTLSSGDGTASATFTGEIHYRTEPSANSLLACYVQDQNNTGALTIVDNNIIYSNAAFLSQAGTLSQACKCNTYYGMAKYGSGDNITCTFSVNTSILKLSVHAPENVASSSAATLTYKSGDNTLAVVSFTVASDYKNNIYMAVPAGIYNATQKLVYKSGEIEKTHVLSNDHANFNPGETYSKKNITFGYVKVNLLDSDYEAIDGDKITGTHSSAARTISIPEGATVTLDNVTATTSGKGLSLRGTGNATIVLSGENTLNSSQTISVVSGKTLTIQGDGILDVTTSTYGAAAIGSYSGNNCGNIVISGGPTITAKANGSGYSAGIGCGATATCGNITINGGTVNATGKNGAGIGANSSSSTHTCGSIEIAGGTVTAIGNGSGTAGIGTGNSNKSTCGDITIRSTVTSVTATMGSGATESIGRGHASSICGTVNIEDGANVTTN